MQITVFKSVFDLADSLLGNFFSPFFEESAFGLTLLLFRLDGSFPEDHFDWELACHTLASALADKGQGARDYGSPQFLC